MNACTAFTHVHDDGRTDGIVHTDIQTLTYMNERAKPEKKKKLTLIVVLAHIGIYYVLHTACLLACMPLASMHSRIMGEEEEEEETGILQGDIAMKKDRCVYVDIRTICTKYILCRKKI